MATLAVSRESSLYIPTGLVASRAVSRETTIFVYYTLADATTALRIASGLHAADAVEQSLLNLVKPGTEVDVLDAMRIAWLASHAASIP
jgi:hypothetical protein